MTVPTLHIQPLAIQYIYIQESNLHWENFCREISERKALLFFQKKVSMIRRVQKCTPKYIINQNEQKRIV